MIVSYAATLKGEGWDDVNPANVRPIKDKKRKMLIMEESKICGEPSMNQSAIHGYNLISKMN